MTDESDTPSLRVLIDEAIEERLMELHLPHIGQVLDFDEDRQTATVQPLVKRVSTDPLTGDVVRRDRAPIHDVPVAFFGGAGGRITGPVRPGDPVLIVHLGVHIDAWHLSGGVVDPGQIDPNRAGGRYSDAVAITGLCDSRRPTSPAPQDALVAHSDAIHLGGPDASQAALKGTAYRAAEDTFLPALGVFASAIGGLPGMAAAAATFATALTDFMTAIAGSNSLSQVVRIK
jgi:hypothetical protein